MKIKDYVYDKNKGIGIVSKIVDQQITVLFDYMDEQNYDTNEISSLVVLNSQLIQYIYKLVEKKDSFIDLYRFKIMNLRCENNDTLRIVLDLQGRNVLLTIDGKNQSIKCAANFTLLSQDITPVLSYLKERLTLLKYFSDNALFISHDLMDATFNFIKTFFDFSWFKKINDFIQQMDFYTLYMYCKKIDSMQINLQLKQYLYMMVANGSFYANQLCNAFLNSNNNIKETIAWVLKKYNETTHPQYALNASIRMFKKEEKHQWVKQMIDTKQIQNLVNVSDLSYKIFVQIIRETDNILLYWNLLGKQNELYFRYYVVQNYHQTIFYNASKKNQHLLLENHCITSIDHNLAELLGFETCLQYAYLMTADEKVFFANQYFNQIVAINPKIIIDMFITSKKDRIGEKEKKLLEKTLPYFNHNQYLKNFINNGIEQTFFENLHSLIN